MPKIPLAQSFGAWLIENTTWSFEQISTFTGMHPLEVETLADNEHIRGIDPVLSKILTREDLERANKDHDFVPTPESLPKKTVPRRKYTPLIKRTSKPDAIAWLLRHHPELSDGQIVRLLGTTRKTIEAIRNKTHRNTGQLNPHSPVDLALCSVSELSQALEVAKKREEKAAKST